MTSKAAPPIAYPDAHQRDLVTATGAHCPTCGQPWKRLAIKVCRKCGRVIGPRHKHHLVPVSAGLFAFEHRNCDEPTSRT
jgi:predicted amidophosphoribosyltransferase